MIAAQPGGELFGVLLQYPGASGEIRDLRPVIDAAHGRGALVAVAADLLALTLLTPPGELGADIAVGSTQRFGVPMGFGGPHAAYMAVRDELRAPAAGPPGRRLRRRRRQAGLPAGAADPRAAHPPREGDQQHLHRAGAAGRDGGDVRRVPRPRRAGRDRGRRAPAGGPAGRHAAGQRPGCARRRVLRHDPGAPGRRRGRRRGPGPGGRLQPAPGRRRHGRHRLRRDHHGRRAARGGRGAGRRAAGRHGAGRARRAPARCSRPAWPGARGSSATRSSTSTTPRRRCCATCAAWPTTTSRWTAR